MGIPTTPEWKQRGVLARVVCDCNLLQEIDTLREALLAVLRVEWRGERESLGTT